MRLRSVLPAALGLTVAVSHLGCPASAPSSPDVTLSAAPGSASEPQGPLTPDALAALRRSLAEADAAFFRGEHEKARAQFEAAWKSHNPNPLALVMAAHAAHAAGDATGAGQLLERARSEARAAASPDAEETMQRCAADEIFDARFDGPGSGWASAEVARLRVDVGRARVLYGHCGVATRDAALDKRAPVSWIPEVIGAQWQHPERSDERPNSVGEAIDLTGIHYGGALGSVKHTVRHNDDNEEYHGGLAISADQSTLASGADGDDREIRVWRLADRSLIRALPRPDHVHHLRLSADGSLLAAGTCTSLTVFDVATAKEVYLQARGIGCWYGSGIGSTIMGTAFSDDERLIAVSNIVMDPDAPDDARGPWLSVYRTSDGTLVNELQLPAFGLVLSPDNGTVAFTDRAQTLLVDLKSGDIQPLAPGWPGAFSKDGRSLFASSALYRLAPPAEPKRVLELSSAALEPVGPYLLPRDL